jgi:hypothetical protein
MSVKTKKKSKQKITKLVAGLKTNIRHSILDGLPVKDAKKGIFLHITSADVKGADKKHPESCAAAKACEREYNIDEVRIHLSRVYLRKGKRWTRYLTSKPLRQEIITFDRGGRFAPGEYALTKPQPTKRLGVQMAGNSSGKKGAKKRMPPTVVTDVRHGPA